MQATNIKELVPVKYKKKFLTPTTRGRAYYLVTHKKAVWFKDKRGTTCIRMKVKPSNDVVDKVTLGIDIGTMYDGYTVNNNKGQFNAELVYTDKVKDKSFIKKLTIRRRANRRLRRARLRHRKARFDNRIGNKETNTSTYYRQHRQNQIKYLNHLFNIEDIVIEDVKFNHYTDPQIIDKVDENTGEVIESHRHGRAFSPLEVGKHKLYHWIKDEGYGLMIKEGYDTFTERNLYFGSDDPKLKNKSQEDFFTHTVDSFILTRFVDNYKLKCKVVHYWHRLPWKCRRQLTRLRTAYKDKKFYYRYLKGGRIKFINHFSKLKKLRIKIDDAKSNHGPWDYMMTTSVQTFKSFLTNYGGTINRRNGISKYWSPIGYIYYC